MFETIQDSIKRNIYTELWEYNNIPGKIQNTTIKNKKSQNSFEFIIEGISSTDISKADKNKLIGGLKNLFDLNTSDFYEKCSSACFGQGNEYKEILRLHSSSLCPLLIFSDIEENNPLDIILDDDISLHFTKVYYEYKNLVIGYPSNVDVVLIGTNIRTGKDTILFLESKFSEYIKEQKAYKVGYEYLIKYNKIYNESILAHIGLTIEQEKDRTRIYKKTDRDGNVHDYFNITCLNQKDACYIEGIKQIISHHIGIQHFMHGDFCDIRPLPKDADIYLGEIFFDFKFDKAKKCLNNYEKTYTKLAKELNTIYPNIKTLPKLIPYSDILKTDFLIPEKVKKFYFPNQILN